MIIYTGAVLIFELQQVCNWPGKCVTFLMWNLDAIYLFLMINAALTCWDMPWPLGKPQH